MAPPPTIDFQAVFGASPNPYMLLDRQLRFVAANAAYERVTGMTLAQLVGRHVFEVFPNDPADPNNVPAAMVRSSLLRALETGKADELALIPYKIPRPSPAGMVLEERIWSA